MSDWMHSHFNMKSTKILHRTEINIFLKIQIFFKDTDIVKVALQVKTDFSCVNLASDKA